MSEVQVDKIQQQCGTTLTVGGGAGKTAVVDATTVTLGRCGGTVALATGATQSGFGRTGTVDWVTTPVTSTPTTGVSGKGYFVNSTGAIKTINLPASPSAGDIMAVSDYAQTASTYNITIGRNGSNIQGNASDLVLTNSGVSITLVYVDGTKGWIVVNTGDESDKAPDPEFISATGGTITTVCTDYKVHTFTGPGTFCVSAVGNPLGSNTVNYLVVGAGGGGGGGTDGSGGGSGAGAGGYRTNFPAACGTSVSVQGYPVVIGAGGGGGGCGSPNPGNDGTAGNLSSALSISSAGGGQGRHGPCGSDDGAPGGSGGGASGGTPGSETGGTGNVPSVSPPQGNNGGNTGAFPAPPSVVYNSAGGGGAGGVGQNAQPGPRVGGPGAANSISGSPVTYATGGNGGTYSAAGTPISNATANTGNGGFGKSTGPGGSPALAGANGGSGIVIIRYKFQ